MKIQATKVLTDIELRNGYTYEFDTSQNILIGIMFLGSTYSDSTFQFKIDSDEIFPNGTPMSLLQTNIYVNPNERFFTRFKPRVTTNLKYKITCAGVNPVPDTTIVFLLDKR